MAHRAVLCLALFPTGFYLNAVYPEALFLALSLGAVWAAQVRRNLVLACVLAGPLAVAAAVRHRPGRPILLHPSSKT